MFKEFLTKNMPIKSQASYVEYGFGQVEPNHLSAQRTAQVYAQLPANKDITILEQGQFVKYDYATHTNGIGEVNFTGEGEWMLVYNEIKLYREHQLDCEFAMIKDFYGARVYSPYDYQLPEVEFQTRFLNGVEADSEGYFGAEDVTVDTLDYYEIDATNDPYKKLGVYKEHMMPSGAAMVPRVFKTNVGDIFTTNTINETELAVGELLTPQAGTEGKGILAKAGADSAAMKWQVVKVYTMPDGQKGVKIMRIA